MKSKEGTKNLTSQPAINLDELATALGQSGKLGAIARIPLPILRKQLETAFYTELLVQYGGNRTKAARAIGSHRNTILNRLKSATSR